MRTGVGLETRAGAGRGVLTTVELEERAGAAGPGITLGRPEVIDL